MDQYKTIQSATQTKTVIKKSTFHAFALPVESEQEAQEHIRAFRKQYYDARHVCYGYQIGVEQSISKSSDNGEPSGTAGRPIMGAIQSSGLTNILIIVVRYFGGILLGTPGLIAAYKEGATSAIQAAQIVERTQETRATIQFDYPAMNSVMKLVKQNNIRVIENQMSMNCQLTIQAPKSIMQTTLPQLLKIETVNIPD